MPDCFVIMPISTPDSTVYGGDAEHFIHVFEHLFKPAIEKAGLTAIPPSAKGSDLIHAEIIKKIEKSELVLCDMSTLNANVFFEFGIRTAVDKPVCIVKDDKTPKVPFDAGLLNYHEYASSLSPWILSKQIDDLTAHIEDSAEGSGDHNTLWKYFGLSSRAALTTGKPTDDDKLELIRLQLASLTRRIEEKDALKIPHPGFEMNWLMNRAVELGIPIGSARQFGNIMTVFSNTTPDRWARSHNVLQREAEERGLELRFELAAPVNAPQPDSPQPAS
jgi:hypothetical protein